jgi:hypothetical protein
MMKKIVPPEPMNSKEPPTASDNAQLRCERCGKPLGYPTFNFPMLLHTDDEDHPYFKNGKTVCKDCLKKTK